MDTMDTVGEKLKHVSTFQNVARMRGKRKGLCTRVGAATPSLVRDSVMMESHTTSSEGRYFQECVHRREMYYTAH